MGNHIFEEITEWSLESMGESTLQEALIKLDIMREGESLITHRVISPWELSSGELYVSIGEVDIQNENRINTMKLASVAITSFPGISLEKKLEDWRELYQKMLTYGLALPKWFLVWKSAIFMHYPPHSLVEYLDPACTLSDDELRELATSLITNLTALAKAKIMPLSLLHDLRTDSFHVYYCGLGFDNSADDTQTFKQLLSSYEAAILPHLAKNFRDIYIIKKQTDSLNE